MTGAEAKQAADVGELAAAVIALPVSVIEHTGNCMVVLSEIKIANNIGLTLRALGKIR